MAGRMKIDPKKKAAAVARILSNRATVEQIADEFKVSKQAVRAWVRERKPAPVAKPPESVSPSLQGPGAHDAANPQLRSPGSSTSPAPGAAPPPADPLARARAAAGIPAGGGGAAPLPSEDMLRQADQADRELVVQTAIDLKTAGLKLLAAKAGLPQEDPDLKKITGLTPIAAAALQANAGWIAPIIREKVQGKLALVVALGIEAIFTLSAFKAILEARGLIKPKKDKDAPEEKKPEEVA